MKKRLWQLHSWLGLLAGLGLLVIGLTGSILVFRTEVDALLAPPKPVAGSGARLSYDELFARVRAQKPGYEINAWWTSPDPRRADSVGLTELAGDDEPWPSVDPTTGTLVSGVDGHEQSFTEWLLELHYAFLGGEWGTFVAGLLAVVLCLLGVSGVWLYREFWSQFFRLRWRASARIFCSDLHKTVGISSVAFNLILGFTGAWWNLSSLPSFGPAVAEEKRPAQPLYNRALSIDALLAEAPRHFPELDLTHPYINLPPFGEHIRFRGAIRGQSALRNPSGSRVDFDPHTGTFLQRRDIRTEGWWTQFEDTFGALHFGTFGGLIVKFLWCLGGFTPGALGVLGFLIWRSRRQRKSAAGMNVTAETQPVFP